MRLCRKKLVRECAGETRVSKALYYRALHRVFFSNQTSKMADGQERERRVISEDDAKIVFETSEEVSVTPTFDSMKIREDLLRGIYAYGKK